MKKLFLVTFMSLLAVVLVLGGCTQTPATTSVAPTPTATTPAAGQPVSGGTLTMAGSQIPKNIGYQPTMGLTDKINMFATIAERLMNMNTQGELVPELATAVNTDASAKTITWTLRKGVKFHDGTDFNAAAAAFNFKQLKDAGVLQYGKSIVSIDTPDDYTLKFTLSDFAFGYVQSFSYNVFILSPALIQSAGKDGAICKVAGTGPFKLEIFDPASKVTVVKNPNYWQTGRPYLDGIVQLSQLDSAVLSAQLQSGEIQFTTSGDLMMQKTLVAKGFKSVNYSYNGYFTFMSPSSSDASSPLNNPLVRQAIEYGTDRDAICNGVLQGTSQAALQMSYPGAVGYDAARGRKYDVNKALALMKQAGYSPDKPIDITIYGTNSKPSIDRRTAIADYLKQIGINAKVEALNFAAFSTIQAEGWKNGLIDCVENSGAVWSVGYANWLGPKPTFNPIPSLGRSAEYDALAAKLLSAPDAAATNSIVVQLIQKNYDDALTFPLWSQPFTYLAAPVLHFDKASSKDRSFDWSQLWLEKK
jgi:peptide/nickel transport system substrate-binding protein